MKPFRMVVAAMLASATTPALAENWIYVLTTDTNSDWYYDADTVRRSGNQVIVWEKREHSRDKTKKEREKLVRIQHDCSERTSTILAMITYFPNGKTETYKLEPYEQETRDVAPGTNGEAMFEAVCKATAGQ